MQIFTIRSEYLKLSKCLPENHFTNQIEIFIFDHVIVYK